MSKLIKTDASYAEWIRSLSLRFKQSQIKAAIKVNSELLKFYWQIGHDIVELKAEERWKKDFWKNMSSDLQALLPGVKGFSITNLQYTRRFYLLYSMNVSEHPQVGGAVQSAMYHDNYDITTQIYCVPWGHHKLIIDKLMGQPEKALFYVRQTIKYGWSRSVLLNFLDTDLFERQGKAVTNFDVTLPDSRSDLAQQLLKDPYCFDFVQLTETYNETELKKELVKNVENFLLEMGNGFAYMGREYRMLVGETELFCDMLFYNTYMHCYVVVEVKTDKFDNSFLGQLSGYVSCANHLLRREGDNPTVGLLICKSKDNVLARYALEGYNQPLGISEYELAKLYPAEFKGTLPSIEEIERELKDK